ncbi:Asp23/Gls24 family envelope stress response protein [Rubrobacter tropicus]|uniref:Asp23/Gls24 family envelope stress response protein n=1 Tax=Rubrobacter tropicus TaxID=2653851 RepID=A0A6G8Q5D3_9ACTN|nr:Asp23/Gls24 family envelope stress response protein [Rubrobacter tropicus]QIN81685.1 Asp23/Gls24 family envelope stress response protein [Rubrobacter tropicus]
MTEAEQRQKESPLLSDRGVTTIKDTVVSRIAGMAAGEVDGVHMGGGASRSAGGFLEGITGSESTTRGVSVEVGSVETALDLKMGIDYGKNILGTVGEVRQKVTERIHSLTGLNVTELNVTIADVVFPEDSKDAGNGSRQESGARSGPQFETRTMPRRELRPGASERESTPVEPRSRSYTEGSSGPVPEEEVRAEGTPVEEDETRRLRVGDEAASSDDARPARREEAEAPASGAPESETPRAEAPTDETTLTGGTSSGERAARETASNEGAVGQTDDRTQEINRERISEGEERRSRRRRRRGEDR